MKFNCAYTKIVNIKELKENPLNANTHSKEQIERLAKLIKYQGQRQAIVVSNQSGLITKGHCRLYSMKLLGWKKVAVDYQDYEDEAQEYADVIADNAISEWAVYDFKKINKDFTSFGPDLDTEFLGFKDFSLDPKMPDYLNGISDSNPQPHESFEKGDLKFSLMFESEKQMEDFASLLNKLTLEYPEIKNLSSKLIYHLEKTL